MITQTNFLNEKSIKIAKDKEREAIKIKMRDVVLKNPKVRAVFERLKDK